MGSGSVGFDGDAESRLALSGLKGTIHQQRIDQIVTNSDLRLLHPQELGRDLLADILYR
jgi:hypothetical protein